jgi:hypothetical protein
MPLKSVRLEMGTVMRESRAKVEAATTPVASATRGASTANRNMMTTVGKESGRAVTQKLSVANVAFYMLNMNPLDPRLIGNDRAHV